MKLNKNTLNISTRFKDSDYFLATNICYVIYHDLFIRMDRIFVNERLLKL